MLLFQIVFYFFALTDMQGNYLEFNDAFIDICGYSSDELKSLDYWTLTPHEYAAQEQTQLQLLEKTGQYGPYEKEYLRKDGSKIPIRLNGLLINDANGSPLIWSMVEDISKQIYSAEQLRKLSRAVEQSHSTIIITNLEANIEFVNPAFTHITGYSSDDVLGKNPRFLQSGRHSAEFYLEMWHTLTSDQVWQGELYNKRKDGSFYWELATISPVKDESGVTTHYLGVKEDITQRKLAEEALNTSEAKYRRLIEDLGDRFVVFSYMASNNQFTYVSTGITAITGLLPSQVIGATWQEIIKCRPEELAAIIKLNAQLVAGIINNTYYQIRYHHLDGNERTLQISVHNVRNTNGQVVAIEGIAEDITEQKQIEAALRIEQVHLYNIIEGANEGFWQLDSNKRTVRVNASLCNLLGYSKEEMLGSSPLDFVDAENRAIFLKQMNSIATSFQRSYEVTLLTKTGKPITTWFNATTLYDEDGKVESAFAFVTNMTRQKQYEQQLIQAKQAAEAANYAKSTFLANISHELRTPLNAILGFAQILLQNNTLSITQHNQITSIKRGGDYLLMLINDILDLIKIETGRIALYPEEVDLKNFFQEIVFVFQEQAKQKGLNFNYFTLTPLPYSLQIDPKRLRQVMVNLLGNAVKFTEKGTVALKVGYSNNQLHITIQDSGIGIDPSQYQEIFKPFTQTDKQRYSTQGTGLGLTIISRILNLMQGTISVDSKLGQGSSFQITIPLAKDIDAIETIDTMPVDVKRITSYTRLSAISTANQDVNSVPAAVSSQPFKILIVDDIADNRTMLRHMLQPLGFDIIEAESGKDCLQQAPNYQPDLVLMDIRMPGINGLETTKRLHALPGFATIPVVIVSASVCEEDCAASYAAGCVEHIAKPVQLDIMLEVLEHNLPLQWSYTPTGTNVKPVASSTPSLNSTQRKELCSLLECGELFKIIEYLEQIAKQPICHEDIKKLLQMAENYQLKEIKHYLEQ
ncbi:hypothetical protein TI03_02635 [Achromatium sp. WMS1]|nr:hypothetical protein TI03_02635 [Achromatium sp. WMS1]